MHTRLLYASSPQWNRLVGNVDRLISGDGFRVLKDEGRTRAGILALEGLAPVFVKRALVRSWLVGILDRFGNSPARRWLQGARMLRAAGFACPTPLVALERIRAGSVRECFSICEALTGAAVLSRAVFGERANTERRRRMFASVAGEVRRLHDAGLYTRDMQETNIMIGEAAGEFRVYFVDLEDFRRTRQVSTTRRLMNLVHLDRSIGRFMSRTARVRFLYSYMGETGLRASRQRIIERIMELRRREDSHASARVRSETLKAQVARASGGGESNLAD
ncbi:MAG TPA: lipopolysaccharide kinase InaA family protein [Candidatus Binataceae bacterium]|nr:lipopolysaccharide kinase InaA family protein [Candidatus Binataceae bacterium]